MDSKATYKNALSLFKLVAALQVMYGHITTHLTIPTNAYIDQVLGVFQGVPIFFTLSGFLIWLSIDRTAQAKKGYKYYLKKRFWRIYPELWVAVAVEIIVMCLLYRGWNVRDTALFTIAQATIFQFWTPDSLRGYGCGTPNGALWTIGVTIQFYIIAWLLYKLLKDKKWHVWLSSFIGSVVISILLEKVISSTGMEIVYKLYLQTVVRYLWMFLLGMAVANFKDEIVPLCEKWWLLLLVTGGIFSISGFDLSAGYGVFKTVFVLLGIIGISYRYPQLALKKDISYGIFIYHMTAVNAMITFGMTGKFIWFVVAAVISIILGYISTITIGDYCARKRIA